MTQPRENPPPADELKEGDVAPDFTAETDEGVPLELTTLQGKRVVLYFYPKDDTPGCTIESCELRDAHPSIVEKDAVVLGVSPDSVASHQKFKKKFDLPFTLIVDEGHHIAERYGVWKPKKVAGREFLGVKRTTFIIGRDGQIAKIFRNVKPRGHAEEVENALGDLP
ncbi:MAG: thioredoxin-dependent thiol peroxidase [Gemmatimonadaceae bacterium]